MWRFREGQVSSQISREKPVAPVSPAKVMFNYNGAQLQRRCSASSISKNTDLDMKQILIRSNKIKYEQIHIYIYMIGSIMLQAVHSRDS